MNDIDYLLRELAAMVVRARRSEEAVVQLTERIKELEAELEKLRPKEDKKK